MIDLDQLTEVAVMELAEGPRFIAQCPQCERQHVLGVDPFYYSGLTNSYGKEAVERRLRKLAADPPLVPCGTCVFRGEVA